MAESRPEILSFWIYPRNKASGSHQPNQETHGAETPRMEREPMEKPHMIPDLQPGDILIFARKSIFDWVIRVKTWSAATHTEIYAGGGKTIASRNGKGCSVYPLDLDGLYCIRRPVQPFNFDKAVDKFNAKWKGKPYGFAELCSFILIDLNCGGYFCSELSTLVFRAGDFEPFTPSIRAETCAPADFLYVSESVLKTIWTAPNY